MFQMLELTQMAQALSQHAGDRLDLIARNVANADTPGYRAVDLPDFAAAYQAEGSSLPLRQTRSGHLATGQASLGLMVEEPQAAPNGNAVSLETEMVKAVSARQENDMALAVYRSSSEILRSCLGRAR